MTEPQIKNYLKNTIGEEAPQPQWGMPNGWGAYLAGENPVPIPCLLIKASLCLPTVIGCPLLRLPACMFLFSPV